MSRKIVHIALELVWHFFAPQRRPLPGTLSRLAGTGRLG